MASNAMCGNCQFWKFRYVSQHSNRVGDCEFFLASVERDDDGDRRKMIMASTEGRDCMGFRDITLGEESEVIANTHLIAAAPELLDACKDALEELRTETWVQARMACNKLRAAIAKAEGH